MAPPSSPKILLATGAAAYGLFVFALLPAPPASVRPGKRPYPADYRLPVYPHDDAGWRDLIRGETKLAAPPR